MESDIPLDGIKIGSRRIDLPLSSFSFEYHVSEIVALKLLPAKTKVKHYDINDLYRDILKGALYRIIFIFLRKRALEIR